MRNPDSLTPIDSSLCQFRRGLFALAAVALSACATQQPAAPAAAAVEQPPLLPPATLGRTRDTQQILRVAFGEHEAVLRCVVHASPERIEVLALTALGQRAMSVAWDGKDWKVETAPMVPSALKPEWMLTDLQLALWPLPVLQAAYHAAGWEVTEPGGGVRRLRHNGQLIAEVDYADADPWHGRYWISNFRFDYALAIEAEAP
ncbi:MAG: hypothetical protein JWR07_2324 [Nevskia sp.]|nr:hypothetical protein [Nevskia sp.]